MGYYDFSPVAVKGLHSEVPQYQVQWAKLQNFMFRRGLLVSRPGLAEIVAVPLVTTETGFPRIITEVLNPRSGTDNGKLQEVLETVRPNSVSACCAGFTPVGAANNALAVDDEPPDDGTTRATASLSSLNPACMILDRPNFATVYDNIEWVMAKARVKYAGTGTVYIRLGVAVCDASETVTQVFTLTDTTGTPTGWVELRVLMPTMDALFTGTLVGIGGLGDLGNTADIGFSSGGAWTLGVLNNATLNDRPQLAIGATVKTGSGHSGTFDVDYMDLSILGSVTGTTATKGVIGSDRVYVTSYSFEKLEDETTATTGFVNIRGSVSIPTGEVLDHTQLYGQLYIVNGTDQIYRYPNASGVFEQFSGRPFGKTIEAFDGRILVGWVTDGSNHTPERIAHTVKGDGQDFTGVGAGNFDLIEGSGGGVFKLKQLSEDVCTAYMQRGIWIIRRTGDITIPYVPDLIDAQTGCLALRTVQTTISPTGTPLQYFLGRNPIDGLSVFAFDGSQTRNVGKPLAKFLRDNATPALLYLAHAVIDPDSGSYWLFIAEGAAATFPNKAWVMDIRTEEWMEATFRHNYPAAGNWRLTAVSQPRPEGKPTLILGRLEDGRPWKADYASAEDAGTITPAVYPALPLADPTAIVPILETGDLRLTEPQLQTLPYSFHFMYYDHGRFNVALDVSIDGGKTFNSALTKQLGTAGADGSLLYAKLDDTVIQGRRIRFRLRFLRFNELTLPPIEIAGEGWLSFETGGDDA